MTRAIPLCLWLPMVVVAQIKPAEPLDSGLVLRFDVDLVQVDAVVTGRDGRRVAGLKPEDFEVLQDGKPQKITHFSYVGAEAERKQAPRAMVILVDDLFMQLGDFVSVRRALTRFIDEELRPGDLVSLFYTSHGSGVLRQFTSDVRELHRAVDRMFWRPPTAVSVMVGDIPLMRELREILRELGTFPGRKSIVASAPGTYGLNTSDVRGIADMANRASVTMYTIDAGAGGRSGTAGTNFAAHYHSQDNMSMLASATGGLYMHDSNATFDQLREAAEPAGYYLIGWYPGASAFQTDDKQPMDYHRVQIRARDKRMQVRSREGYFAQPGTPGPQPVPSARQQMRHALVSPFRSGDLDVRLSADFVRQEAAGSYVDLQMHIAAKGLRFEQGAGGCWNARVELARALWPLDPGLPPNDRVNTQLVDLQTCGRTAEEVWQEGFVAAVEERVPSPGAYQVRVAVRNAETDDALSFGPAAALKREGTEPVRIRVGSATQFLVIPDLRGKGPALSGVALWSGEPPAAPGADVSYRLAKDGDAAVRRFGTHDEVHYGFRVFGEAADVRLRVIRDGREVTSVPAAPMTGALPKLAAGDYVLGVVASNGKKGLTAEQWIDFEVRR